MKLNSPPKTTTSKKKRLGRGYGSGKGGHTASRGQKGQKSRSSVAAWFEGGQLPLTRKLPFLRGKDRFKNQNTPVTPVNLADLNHPQITDTVSPQVLVQAGIVSTKEAATTIIKILGTGELKNKLTFENVKISQPAAKKIKQAGGTIKPEPQNQQSK